MSRAARIKSESGYYHVIVRGIGKQLLFEEDNDCLHYLELLKRFSKETGITICAFCLMENHVHLLIHDPDHHLSTFMKKLGVSYSIYFNQKYGRTGHLFQDRYQSENVESEEYLVTVFRYILNNPQKAGICPADSYKWSSYKHYGSTGSFVDTSVFTDLIGNKQEYTAFIAAKADDQCMDIQEPKLKDKQAQEIIKNLLNNDSGTIIQSFDAQKRNEIIKLLRTNGLSIRQIERLTGISRGIIQRLV